MEFEIGGKANTNIAASKEKRTSGRYRPVLARLLVVTVLVVQRKEEHFEKKRSKEGEEGRRCKIRKKWTEQPKQTELL